MTHDFAKTHEAIDTPQRARRTIIGGDECLPVDDSSHSPYCTVGYLDRDALLPSLDHIMQ